MEKVYKTMKRCGIASLVFGIVVIVTGAVCGGAITLMGAKLLARKDEITF